MSLGLAARRLIPQSAKNFLRQRTLPWRVSILLSPYLPISICVDVGASYYPHGKWLAFLNAPRTQWLAVEPNEANIGYVKSWRWPCQVAACTTGLSREGGTQTLYVTNVDTGSSLLPPEITPSMKHRVSSLGYFFPVTERRIETLTLVQALAGLSATAPVFVKLDTQGTELSILQGAQPLFDERRIVGIEMESTLLAQPVMKGSGKFWQACEYMEQQGFELLHIKPIAAVARSGRVRSGRNTYLNECDAVFALRPDVAATLAVEYRVSLLAFYLTNLFYEEAMSLLEHDAEVVSFLSIQGCSVDALVAILKAAV
ncbi:FkbM family methyltransferase [Curvibacter sp. APW13]|uniref:FkbM family methyltransferase n=1 Tax=Curvibacter sp. APW13 TaxID=3077236 RepID=UPI0028DD4083|nr:FkbM family methyltransferase [Curvibacter sp. APW13]MDT8993093.1 FkbM family methyltransferase [Curvibacter sp. APW13]